MLTGSIVVTQLVGFLQGGSCGIFIDNAVLFY